MWRLDDFLERLERLDAFAQRQPRWRWYVAFVVMAVVVGTASGHSFETASGNAAFDVILFGTVDAIHVLSRRRRLRLIAGESVEDLSTGESAPTPRS
jgi:uncharacterized membrane protein